MPRAWSYGSAEVAVVEAPAGAARPTSQPRAPAPAHPEAPSPLARTLTSIGRTLTSLVVTEDGVGADERTVAAETTGSASGPHRR